MTGVLGWANWITRCADLNSRDTILNSNNNILWTHSQMFLLAQRKLILDLPLILHKRIEALPPGAYSAGLRAVLQHIQVAVGHHLRGTTQPDETAFTDAIYRTNQAFEGSLKEAYRVLTGKDPLKIRPFDIETFFQEHGILRTRVLAQFSNYRKEWRNPSAHDYQLDFDEDEALLAIVSVCAFAIVLIDQIVEKLSFDAAKAATPRAVPTKGSTKSLPDLVAEAVEKFEFSSSAEKSQNHARETEITGALAGYLSSAIPDAQVDLEPRLSNDSPARPDLLIKVGDEQLLIEVKRVGRLFLNLNDQYIAQVAQYIALSGIKEALVYVHSENPDKNLIREEHHLPELNARVVIIGPSHKNKAEC